VTTVPADPDPATLRRRLERERRARREAEAIAEDALRQVYDSVRAMRESQAVIDETTDFVLIADVDGRIRYMNRSLLEMLGLEAQKPGSAERNVTELLTAASRERFLSDALPVVRDKGIWRGELAMVQSVSGSEMPVSQVLIGHRGPTGVVESISSISRDITDRLAMEEQLTRLALHDSLTGLPNRRLFFDRLDVALARAQRTGAPVGVLFVDVDDFKSINDTMGHEAGDTVLVEVARRLVECVRPSDTVCRLGGDEFSVLCEHVGDEQGVATLGQRLGRRVAEPIDIGGTDVRVTVSVGVVTATSVPEGPERLLHLADAAMYDAKRRGKGGVTGSGGRIPPDPLV
jgi:diguanylate cyclase (GGDEF)-like protein/PAS domain S-box-containing protein